MTASRFQNFADEHGSLAAPSRRYARWCAFTGVIVSLFAPMAVRSDIYQWTDEQGGTVISNVLPDSPDQAKNMKRVVKETKPAAPGPRPAATPTEQLLLEKIENLERRLQARAPGAAPADSYYDGGYYPPPPPPPPAYYPNYAPVYYTRPAYSYPLVPAYSYVVYPRTFVTRSAPLVVHRGTTRGGATHHRWR